MSTVFISYRRENTAGKARALFNDLVGRLGDKSVFMDVDSIALGRDFRSVLQETTASCDLMLVIIGRNWADAKDERGRIRLENPSDYVRLEIETALKRNIAVTPVLVQGAQMPAPEVLPAEIRDLAYRNGFELGHTRWESDVGEMIRRLGLDAPSVPTSQPKGRRRLAWVLIPGLLIAAIGGGLLLLPHRDQMSPDGSVKEAPSSHSGAFIEGTFGARGRNFELVVPQGNRLVHYFRDNDGDSGWHRVHEIDLTAQGGLARFFRSASLIQSSFLNDGIHGNLEMVAWVETPATSESALMSFFLDSRTPPGGQGWQDPIPITLDGQPISGVTGAPALIQGTFGARGRNFELVVPQGNRLVHYFHDNDGDSGWHQVHEIVFISSFGPRLLPQAVSLIQAKLPGGDRVHGNLEMIVWMQGSSGSTLDAWTLDSSTPPGGKGWKGPTQITVDGQPISGVTGVPSLIQGTFGVRRRNFELVVPQGNRLIHYFRDNDGDSGWHQVHEIDLTAQGALARFFRSASLIQSSFLNDGIHGNLEMVAWVETPATAESALMSFFLDSRTPPGGQGWQDPIPITVDGQPISGVTGL